MKWTDLKNHEDKNRWKPDGDTNSEYYTVYIDPTRRSVTTSDRPEIWENGNTENEKWEKNLVFKTKAEAVARANEIRKNYMPIYLKSHIPNIFKDGIAFLQNWEFAYANTCVENRIMAITQVASICYQSPKALGSESLYNRLAAESQGLPSSSFEFVPVLLSPDNHHANKLLRNTSSNVRKYGEWVEFTNIIGVKKQALLTNYRALYYDYEKELAKAIESYKYTKQEMDLEQVKQYYKELYLDFFNDDIECKCIEENFKVFLFKVDFPTRSQMVRHRVNWQELSRRYVSGERVEFDFYISEKMKPISSKHKFETLFRNEYINGNDDLTGFAGTPLGTLYETIEVETSTEKVIAICLEHYYEALRKGVKPQEARRIIPQAAYTQIWGAFMPSQLENYFKLRDDDHAQWEIRQTAIAMKNTLVAHKYMDSITPEREEELNRRVEEIESGNAKFLTKEEISALLDAADSMDVSTTIKEHTGDYIPLDECEELISAKEEAKRKGIQDYEIEEL